MNNTILLLDFACCVPLPSFHNAFPAQLYISPGACWKGTVLRQCWSLKDKDFQRFPWSPHGILRV